VCVPHFYPSFWAINLNGRNKCGSDGRRSLPTIGEHEAADDHEFDEFDDFDEFDNNRPIDLMAGST